MNRRGHRGKVDSTQAAIKAVAESYGWQAVSTAGVGDGFPDLLCWRHPQGFRLIECKSKGGTLTPAQVRFRQRFSMPILHILSKADAEDVFSAITKEVPLIGVIRDSNGQVRPRKAHDGKSYDEHQLGAK